LNPPGFLDEPRERIDGKLTLNDFDYDEFIKTFKLDKENAEKNEIERKRDEANADMS
jgi:hypothetical protein